MNDGLTQSGWPLLSCPYCGKESVKVIVDDGIHTKSEEKYRAECRWCGAQGPPGTSTDQAKWKWDTRLKS